MRPLTSTFREYIRETTQKEWHITFKKYKCYGRFLEITYKKCCTKDLVAYSKDRQNKIKGERIRMLLKNESWYLAFVRTMYPEKFEEILSYKRTLVDSWK